jgi:hypothetical protein
MDRSNCPDALWADLPDDPSQALAYHYGMLLGAADLRTEQGYHVGKARRHARTLHGQGVVQGFQVTLDGDELKVSAGLALDARGRELALGERYCVSLPAWWKAHRDLPEFAAQKLLDVVTLQLELRIGHLLCCERPVPAVAPTCQGEDGSPLMPSRFVESARLDLVDASGLTEPSHGVPDAERPLYALLGLAAQLPPGDADVEGALNARSTIAAADPADRPALALAALDRGIAVGTARLDAAALPGDDGLPLARLRDLVLKRSGDDAYQVTGGRVEILDRPALLSTATLQRLLAALLATSPLVAAPVLPPPAPAPAPTPPAAPPAPLPFVTAAVSNAERLTLTLAEAVHGGSVQPTAFSVAELDDTHGWRSFSVRHVDVEAGGTRLLLTLGHAPVEKLMRIVIDLAGRKPVLAASGAELDARYRNAFMLNL